MIGWLVALGVLSGITLLPLGVRLRYGADGPEALLLIGPVRIPLLQSKNKRIKDRSEQNFEEKKKQTNTKLGSVDEFLSLIRILLDLLSELRYKLRVSCLEMTLILGDADPCKIGTRYGSAWAVLGNMMPLLENVFVIRKRNLQVQADFMASNSLIIARADITITFGRALWLVLKYGLRGLREYLNTINNKKAVQ